MIEIIQDSRLRGYHGRNSYEQNKARKCRPKVRTVVFSFVYRIGYASLCGIAEHARLSEGTWQRPEPLRHAARATRLAAHSESDLSPPPSAIVAGARTRFFGERIAVDSVSFEVVAGEIFGFLDGGLPPTDL
jgi:hypothetical protein